MIGDITKAARGDATRKARQGTYVGVAARGEAVQAHVTRLQRGGHHTHRHPIWLDDVEPERLEQRLRGRNAVHVRAELLPYTHDVPVESQQQPHAVDTGKDGSRHSHVPDHLPQVQEVG